jgi:hypothetical protein
MTIRTKLGILRELRSIMITDIEWLEAQKAVYFDLLRKKNELLDDIEGEIQDELGRLRPVVKGQPIAIEFITGNPDD